MGDLPGFIHGNNGRITGITVRNSGNNGKEQGITVRNSGNNTREV